MPVTVIRTFSSSQIGSYLTKASASTTYLTQISASTNYLSQASASNIYLTQESASTTYLPQASASSTYLTQASASSTYLPQSSASSTYLTQASASTTYLPQASASSTYLTQASASSTYLPQSSASSTYLTQASASSTYLPQASASSTYLSQANAALTYLTQAYASSTYLTQASASTIYSTIASPQFSGNVGIGVAGDSGSQLTVGKSSSTEGGQIGFTRSIDNALSYYIDVFGSSASPVFRFVDAAAGAVRLNINSSGIVTTPAVPAFSVYVNFLQTQSGNLTYNATNNNNGGYMNLGTGLFTAPVAGHYHFNYYGFVDTGLGGNTTITFQKNGGAIPSRAYNDFNDASYGPVITISAVIYLAAGDNVRVNISGAGVHGNDSSYFSGFLIG
jgi:uncharacterized protein YjbI with pentapeptide repeats